MKYYKVLSNDGRSCHGGSAAWSLPVQNNDGSWTPGEWMPRVKGRLVLCENGYHLAREQDLIHWLGEAIYEAEPRGELIETDDKVLARDCRLLRQLVGWNDRTARLFACDCAERVLPLYERDYPGDQRPRQAIAVARCYANGQATDNELAAAWDAAWDAAGAAAGDAAWDAARAAARAAAGAAAWDAARAAARAAAGAAAWDAARAAAGAAAWAAARAAERAWQTARLFYYLEGG
jgi:hypothetical protein